MKWTASTIAVLLGLLLATVFTRTLPETNVTFYPPKQLHHVIYISVCGVLEGVIITTSPPQFADWKHKMTDEMIQLEREAQVAGRVHTFNAGLWFTCGKPEPDDLRVVQ